MKSSEFRWALAYLLPTLLVILHGVSRVRNLGLKRDSLGGMFLLAPTALCGSPDTMQGMSGLPASPFAAGCLLVTALLLPKKMVISVDLADTLGKVCQGRRFPKGYACFR